MTSPDYASHFSASNIPFGIASSAKHAAPSAVTRLHNKVIFLDELAASGSFSHIEALTTTSLTVDTLNELAALPGEVHRGIRDVIRSTYESDNSLGNVPAAAIEDVEKITMHLPVRIGDFTGIDW